MTQKEDDKKSLADELIAREEAKTREHGTEAVRKAFEEAVDVLNETR